MILSKLTRHLLHMLLRYIRRQTITRLLGYCRRAGWPKKEIHSLRCALIVLFRLLLRLLRARLIKRNAAAISRPDNASC